MNEQSMIYRIQELREAGYTWRQCDMMVFETNTNDKCFKIAQKYKIAAFSISNKVTQPRVSYKKTTAAPAVPQQVEMFI